MECMKLKMMQSDWELEEVLMMKMAIKFSTVCSATPKPTVGYTPIGST